MAWSGGTFTRTNGVFSGSSVWASDNTAGTKITTAHHDTHDQDLATGINACLNKNGQNSPTANISWGGFKITSLAAGTVAGDAVRYEQVIGVFQPLAAGLTSIAGLTTAADKGIYTSALDTYVVYTLTAGGRALAAVAGTADTFPYFSAANTVTLGSLTAAGRALLDDADAAAQRTTLGLADAAVATVASIRTVPITDQNATYTFVATDAGKARRKTNTTAYTYTVDNSIHAAGDILTVINTGATASITLAQGAGVTLQLAGGTTTGNRTVGPGGVAYIYFQTASYALVSGAGVT